MSPKYGEELLTITSPQHFSVEKGGDTLTRLNGNLFDLVGDLKELQRTSFPGWDSIFIRKLILEVQQVLMYIEPFCEPLPSTTAIRNDLILEEILKHLSTPDLLKFRLVNKHWYALSMKTLTRTRSVKIYIHSKKLACKQLPILNQRLVGSNLLPIQNLSLELQDWEVWAPQSTNLIQFFKVHGPQIKSLTLNGSSRYTPIRFVSNLFYILKNYFPNVEHLEIGRDFVAPRHPLHELEVAIPVGEEPFSLWSIRSISFDGWLKPAAYLMDILVRASVCLTKVQGSHESVIMALIATGRTELLKSYKFSIDSLRQIFYLAVAHPKLENLEVDIFPLPSAWTPDVEGGLQTVLESSRNTLTFLSMYLYHMHLTREICFPNLQKLRLTNCGVRLSFKHEPGPRKPIFPMGTVLCTKFPQLRCLILQIDNVNKESLDLYFPGDDFKNLNGKVDTLLTVEDLTLDCRIARFGLRALAKKFPNVVHLRGVNYQELFMDEESVWYVPWTRLENLELAGFAFGDLFWKRSLDSFFTGFPDDICRNLREIKEGTEVLMNYKIVTKYPSVRNLRNLKNLRVVFNSPRNQKWAPAGKLDLDGISHLVGLYGFSRMRNLQQVTFAYNQRHENSKAIAAALEPLWSFRMIAVEHVEFGKLV